MFESHLRSMKVRNHEAVIEKSIELWELTLQMIKFHRQLEALGEDSGVELRRFIKTMDMITKEWNCGLLK